MSTPKMLPQVDAYINEKEQWREETAKSRKILLACGLTEEFKWGKPCYTFEESNVVIIQGFKGYFALMFCKGALLKDARGLLVKPGENTQGARQFRFKDAKEIAKLEPVLKAYVHEAVAAEKAGLEVNFKAITELKFPEELQAKLAEDPALKKAFEALTPGRQRGYNLFFSAAKQAKTRMTRIEKCVPLIFKGKGLHD